MIWFVTIQGILLVACMAWAIRLHRRLRQMQSSTPSRATEPESSKPQSRANQTDDPLALALLDTHRRIQRRMASDLHDGVHQNLAGISMLLGSLSNRLRQPNAAPDELLGTAADKLDRLVGMVHDTQQLAEHRTLSHKADRRIPGDQFPDALGRLAKNIETFFAVESKVRGTLPHSIQGDLAGHLYRISEEAAYNAVRHGAAKTVIFGLEVDGNEAILTVEDDGRGITEDRDPEGRGLHLMALRCAKFDGQLDVRPQPGGGTQVICRWPWTDGLRPDGSRSDVSDDGTSEAGTTESPQTPEAQA